MEKLAVGLDVLKAELCKEKITVGDCGEKAYYRLGYENQICCFHYHKLYFNKPGKKYTFPWEGSNEFKKDITL